MTEKVERVHVTQHPLKKLQNRSQFDPRVPPGHMKPKGLWYSIGRAWEEWRESEMPKWVKPPLHRFRLTLDMSRILRLDTPEAVMEFNHRYSVETLPGLRMLSIDWREVAKEHAGVECAPYFWSLRYEMDLLWYYGWDVPSGCVWDVSAVQEFTEIKRRLRKPEEV